MSAVPYLSLCTACIVSNRELQVNGLEVMFLDCITLNRDRLMFTIFDL